jgi:hypothetical protein
MLLCLDFLSLVAQFVLPPCRRCALIIWLLFSVSALHNILSDYISTNLLAVELHVDQSICCCSVQCLPNCFHNAFTRAPALLTPSLSPIPIHPHLCLSPPMLARLVASFLLPQALRAIFALALLPRHTSPSPVAVLLFPESLCLSHCPSHCPSCPPPPSCSPKVTRGARGGRLGRFG